jgi:short-subunit dehydrogenase
MQSLAVITGAGAGIGRALALEGASRGFSILGIEADQVRAEALDTVLGTSGRCLTGDVRRIEDLETIAQVCGDAPISLVFANAGVLRAGKPWEQRPADRDLVLDVNVKGVLNTLQAFAPRLFAQSTASAVVFTASLASFAAPAGLDAYAASKHAVLAIAAGFAGETRSRHPHVRSVLLCPGAVHTAIADDDVEGPGGRLQASIRRRAQDGASPQATAFAAFEAIADGRDVVLLDDRALGAIAARAEALCVGRLL